MLQLNIISNYLGLTSVILDITIAKRDVDDRFLSLASADSEDDNTADVTGLEHQLSKMSSSPQLSR